MIAPTTLKRIGSPATDLTGLEVDFIKVIRPWGRRRTPSGQVKRVWVCACKCGSAVLKIRSLANNGLPYVRIAERFVITPEHVSGIAHRKTWKHLS